MASVIEYRVMLNRPGPGWYWEVIHKREIVARGLADTRIEADSQAAEVVQQTRHDEAGTSGTYSP